jgi:hypothetical protein
MLDALPASFPSQVLEDISTITAQVNLAHKKPPPSRTLREAYAYGPVVVLEGRAF